MLVTSNKPYDIEERLISFAGEIVTHFNFPLKTFASKYYAQQLIIASGSAALNYGEFAGAGTQKDRLNKLRLSLKELKECKNNLKIQQYAKLLTPQQKVLVDECTQLVKILATVIKNNENKI